MFLSNSVDMMKNLYLVLNSFRLVWWDCWKKQWYYGNYKGTVDHYFEGNLELRIRALKNCPGHRLLNISWGNHAKENKNPVDLYLISEKSIWENQVGRTGFLVYFELNFYCLCSLSSLQNQNWFLQAFYPVRRTWFFKIQVQINRGSIAWEFIPNLSKKADSLKINWNKY